MAASGMLRRVALVRTDVSEEFSTSIIRVTIIGEVGTALRALYPETERKLINGIDVSCVVRATLQKGDSN
jgi:hypothetical protein